MRIKNIENQFQFNIINYKLTDKLNNKLNNKRY